MSDAKDATTKGFVVAREAQGRKHLLQMFMLAINIKVFQFLNIKLQNKIKNSYFKGGIFK